MSASYDCSVCYCTLEGSTATLDARVQGPWDWADALFMEESGRRLVVQVMEDILTLEYDIFLRMKQYLNLFCGTLKAALLFQGNVHLRIYSYIPPPPAPFSLHSGQVGRSQ